LLNIWEKNQNNDIDLMRSSIWLVRRKEKSVY